MTASRDSSLTCLHFDHLGSVSLATDPTGAVASQQEFDPWGAVRTGPISQTSLNYTGQRLDATGLLYYHARYYNPVLARFLSPDTLVPDLHDPQDLNRYSYVKNNPLNHTDPSGHCTDALTCGYEAAEAGTATCGPWCGAAAGVAVAVLVGAGAGYVLAEPTHLERTKPAQPLFQAEDADAGAKGTNEDAQEEEGLYKRPSGWRKGVAEKALDEAPTNDQNEKICPTCGNVLPDKITVDTKNGQVEQRGYQLDHYPDTVAERRVVAKREGWTRKQWLDDYNKRVRAQCGPCNVGHEWEGKPGPYGTRIE